jgi:hypothetical protein
MPKIRDWRDEIAKHLAGLKLPPEREAGIIDELALHLNEEYERHLLGGATEAEAFEMAMEDLDGEPALAEALHGVEGKVPESDALGTTGDSIGGDL